MGDNQADARGNDAERALESGNVDSDANGANEPSKPLSSDHKKNNGFFSAARVFGPVSKSHGDLSLLAHCFATGMVDAATFSNWDVFVGMQTGNTVILGLSAATIPSNPHAWLTTLVSIASFLIGALFTFRLTLYAIPKGITSNRLYLSSILMLQALLIILSAALLTPASLVPHNRSGVVTAASASTVVENIDIVALIPPLAFQAGMQIATSRLLGYSELPVNVLTSTYCDIMGDVGIFKADNVKRNRRVSAAVLLLAGAISTGWLLRSEAGMAGVLWIAGGFKFLVAVAAFLFMRREAADNEH